MAITARMKRLAADCEQVKKDFAGNRYIIVTSEGGDYPEKYHVTYYLNGIYLLEDGRIEIQGRHEVDIELHADYPRYKPICTISTPIWHPNFRDGQICIGDIWGAGESLSDIIINIGDMIQYKSWNSFSPLSADAAQWAIENKSLFPVGTIDLNVSDYAYAKDSVEIDLFDECEEDNQSKGMEETPSAPVVSLAAACMEEAPSAPAVPPAAHNVAQKQDLSNDFEITASELEGVTFVPTATRMQSISRTGVSKGNKVNFRTIFTKGLIWAFIGALLGFVIGSIPFIQNADGMIANMMGYSQLGNYFEAMERVYDLVDVDTDAATTQYQLAQDYLLASYEDEFSSDTDKLGDTIASISRIDTGIWSAVLALFLGLLLGIGEGLFYGSKEQAIKFGLIGAAISLAIGFISGYFAQYLYASLINDSTSDLASAFIRGIGWAVMGLGVGLAIGLIKPEKKRILFCALGGLVGAFIGGFAFNFICDVIPNDVVAQGFAVLVMGLLIGLGVGLLEQFAKQAWLKVIRGAFEGKEYLVFNGTTSIGNNASNTIVLFKDKLVGPHHCDIVQEGSRFVLIDAGTPLGTLVNGQQVSRQPLRNGDSLSIGNSVLVFNMK